MVVVVVVALVICIAGAFSSKLDDKLEQDEAREETGDVVSLARNFEAVSTW